MQGLHEIESYKLWIISFIAAISLWFMELSFCWITLRPIYLAFVLPIVIIINQFAIWYAIKIIRAKKLHKQLKNTCASTQQSMVQEHKKTAESNSNKQLDQNDEDEQVEGQIPQVTVQQHQGYPKLEKK